MRLPLPDGYKSWLCAVACCVLLPPQAFAAVIPFKLEGHNIIVQMQLTPRSRLPFVFDSGLSNGNIITPEAARSAGIKPERDMGVRDAGGDRRAAGLARVPSIGIGAVTLKDVPFAITQIPREVLAMRGGGSLAGFVGAPLMKDAVLCIDYSHGQLRHANRTDFEAGALIAVPMKLNHGLPTVAVSIDGRPATLIVDSGAESALTVFASFAEANDFGHRYHPLGTQDENGGNGKPFEALIVQAEAVSLGPGAQFAKVPLEVIPQGMNPEWGIDGMMGFQMLRQLEPCLDRDGERLFYRGE
jgi:predicted aspartyl protease